MSNITDNGKKKSSQTKLIATEDILAIYEEVLPLMYNNPDGLSIVDEINKRLLLFVHYDFFHYSMEDPRPGAHSDKLNLKYHDWARLVDPKDAVEVLISSPDDLKDHFDRDTENSYRKVIELRKIQIPEEKSHDYLRIESRAFPRIVIGFFRATGPAHKTPFTPVEKEKIQELTPHILRLFRTALTYIVHAHSFQYFDTFTKIGSRISSEHGLSDSETKLIPDILFGYTNEEIAERHFVSVATVKTHVNHILKKTGTKKRMDFITKFFTSPENVEL